MSRPDPERELEHLLRRWTPVAPPVEPELTRLLDLVLSLNPHDLSDPDRYTYALAGVIRRALPQMVAADGHSATPIRDGWCTLPEVELLLGTPARTLRRWTQAGKGPGGVPIRSHRIGNTWLVNEHDLTKAARNHEERDH